MVGRFSNFPAGNLLVMVVVRLIYMPFPPPPSLCGEWWEFPTSPTIPTTPSQPVGTLLTSGFLDGALFNDSFLDQLF
jgi:hypothetical protein